MEFDWNGTTEQKRTLASVYVLCYPKPLCPNFGVRTEQSGTGSCRNLEEEQDREAKLIFKTEEHQENAF